MLDFGFPELLLIIAVAVLVIGPQEIPALMVAVGRFVRRLNYVRFAVSRQFDQYLHEAGLDDVADQVNFENKTERAPKGAGFDEAAEDEEYITGQESKDE